MKISVRSCLDCPFIKRDVCSSSAWCSLFPVPYLWDSPGKQRKFEEHYSNKNNDRKFPKFCPMNCGNTVEIGHQKF